MSTPNGLNLPELLLELEVRVRDQGAPVADLLAPGLPEEQIRSALAAIGLAAPDEVVQWFSWHNGTVRTQPRHEVVLILWRPYSLEEAIQQWLGRERAIAEGWWREEWLPIGDYFNADRLAVHCPNPATKLAVVRNVVPEEGGWDEDEVPSVQSLALVVSWWLDALRRRWVRWDANIGGWDNQGWYDSAPEEQRRTLIL